MLHDRLELVALEEPGPRGALLEGVDDRHARDLAALEAESERPEHEAECPIQGRVGHRALAAPRSDVAIPRCGIKLAGLPPGEVLAERGEASLRFDRVAAGVVS